MRPSQGLRRAHSAEPGDKHVSVERNKKSTSSSLQLSHLEAYIPVSVVEYVKTKHLQIDNLSNINTLNLDVSLKVKKNGKEKKEKTKKIRKGNFKYNAGMLPLSQQELPTPVMFIDVSSFTVMSEKMTAFGPAGLERLVDNLNSLFDVILKKARDQGGDVMKFAGDAMELYWPRLLADDQFENESEPITVDTLVIRAVIVALEIQNVVKKRFRKIDFTPFFPANSPIDKSNLDIPSELKIKLGIGLGKLTVIHLGGAIDMLKRSCVEFTPMGQGIVDAHSCERKAEAGQVIVSESIFKVLENDSRFHMEMVKGTTVYDPLFIVSEGETKIFESLRGTLTRRKHSGKQLNLKSASVGDDLTEGTQSQPTMTLASQHAIAKVRQNLEQLLYNYLPSTVMPYLDKKNEGWLPEFRRVTTIFFKIHLEQSILDAVSAGNEHETTLLQQSFLLIQETVFRYQGCINKMFFDKGSWNVLVVFGLSPFAHDDDARRGVLCALAVVGLLDQKLGDNPFDEEAKVAAGVTTGLAFCGVLGSVNNVTLSSGSTINGAYITPTMNFRGASLAAQPRPKGSRTFSSSFAFSPAQLGRSVTAASKTSNNPQKKSQVFTDDVPLIPDYMRITREQKEYTVIGDCVNLASRLMDLAHQKNAYLFFDEATTLATPGVDFMQYGTEGYKVKGKKDPVKVFTIAEKNVRTGFSGNNAENNAFQNIANNKFKRMSVARPTAPTHSVSKGINIGLNMMQMQRHPVKVGATKKRSKTSKNQMYAPPATKKQSLFGRLSIQLGRPKTKKQSLLLSRPPPRSFLQRPHTLQDNVPIEEADVESQGSSSNQLSQQGVVQEIVDYDTGSVGPRRSMMRGRSSIDVKHYTRAEKKLLKTLQKTNDPTARRAAKRTMYLNHSRRQPLKASPDALDSVLKKLELIRASFRASYENIIATGSLQQNVEISKLGNAYAANVTAGSEESTESKNIVNSNIRFVCLEGSVGAGKTHSIAQIFHSRAALATSNVFFANVSPFESPNLWQGFSIWKNLIELFLCKYNDDVGVGVNDNETMETLINLALKNSQRARAASPIPAWAKSRHLELRKYETFMEYKYLLNDIFGTNFERKDMATPPLELRSADIAIFDTALIGLMSSDAPEAEHIPILHVVTLIAAIFAGLGQLCYDKLDGKNYIAIIDDAQVMNPLSWLLCVELTEWWSASNVLLVLGLRNILFLDPHEKKKTKVVRTGSITAEQLSESGSVSPINDEAEERERDKDFQNTVGLRLSVPYKMNAEIKDFTRTKLGMIPMFRARLKELSNSSFISLKNKVDFVETIIRHAKGLDDEQVVPGQILDFFSVKTAGNPLYIVDALTQYEAEGLLRFYGDQENGNGKMQVSELFYQKIQENALTVPISVESVCGMLLDSLTTSQQIALKVAAIIGQKFSRKAVIDAFPIVELKDELDDEWEALVSADVIEIVDDTVHTPDGESVVSTTTKMISDVNALEDSDNIYYKFQAEWVKESLVNRMLYKQRMFLRETIETHLFGKKKRTR